MKDGKMEEKKGKMTKLCQPRLFSSSIAVAVFILPDSLTSVSPLILNLNSNHGQLHPA